MKSHIRPPKCLRENGGEVGSSTSQIRENTDGEFGPHIQEYGGEYAADQDPAIALDSAGRQYEQAGETEQQSSHHDEIRFVPVDFGCELHRDQRDQQYSDGRERYPYEDAIVLDHIINLLLHQYFLSSGIS
jgi:hypothetical protein